MAGMMTGLLLLLLAGVAVGRVLDLQKRIIGGQTCGATDRRYHVRLIANDGTRSFLCGGSLISDQWILTAAHCVQSGWTVTAFLNEHPDPRKAVQVNAQPVRVRDDHNLIHDIMLLKLDPHTEQVTTVDLPDCGKRPKPGHTVQIAGRAATAMHPNGLRGDPGEFPHSHDLQCADTTVVDCVRSGTCLPPLPGYYFALDNVICFKKTGVDISPGDSGGGVVFDKKIYGVISFTSNGGTACVSPGAATDVCEYKAWITKITGIAIPSTCPTCNWQCLLNCFKG